MHKDFYASGFLYHSRTQRILLQQKNTAGRTPEWCLLGDSGHNNEKAEEAFVRIIEKILHVNLKPSNIKSIYTYFHDTLGKDNFVSYAKVTKMQKFPPKNGNVFGWFSFKEVVKLKLSAQTKQDITVGQRVIDASIRKRLGQRTIE